MSEMGGGMSRWKCTIHPHSQWCQGHSVTTPLCTFTHLSSLSSPLPPKSKSSTTAGGWLHLVPIDWLNAIPSYLFSAHLLTAYVFVTPFFNTPPLCHLNDYLRRAGEPSYVLWYTLTTNWKLETVTRVLETKGVVHLMKYFMCCSIVV